MNPRDHASGDEDLGWGGWDLGAGAMLAQIAFHFLLPKGHILFCFDLI
jgi:hypothetical protein